MNKLDDRTAASLDIKHKGLTPRNMPNPTFYEEYP